MSTRAVRAPSRCAGSADSDTGEADETAVAAGAEGITAAEMQAVDKNKTKNRLKMTRVFTVNSLQAHGISRADAVDAEIKEGASIQIKPMFGKNAFDLVQTGRVAVLVRQERADGVTRRRGEGLPISVSPRLERRPG
jgi:redox-sensitive bicupin YhaK (pirin superfamily)